MYNDGDEKDTKLLELLKERQSIYNTITERIFDSFGDCLLEVIKLYSDVYSSVTLRDIECNAGLEGFVKVTAIGFPLSGTNIEVEDKTVHISDENSHLFKSIIRMILPVKLLQSKDCESMADFVKDLSYIIPIASDVNIEKLLNLYYNGTKVRLSEIDFFHTLLESGTRPKVVDGFATATLSEIQMSALNLFKSCSTETVN